MSEIIVGTTKWVAEDPTGNTVGLAKAIGGVPLLGAGLNFATSRYPSFRAYNRGYVKEGVGAGGLREIRNSPYAKLDFHSVSSCH